MYDEEMKKKYRHGILTLL